MEDNFVEQYVAPRGWANLGETDLPETVVMGDVPVVRDYRHTVLFVVRTGTTNANGEPLYIAGKRNPLVRMVPRVVALATRVPCLHPFREEAEAEAYHCRASGEYPNAVAESCVIEYTIG